MAKKNNKKSHIPAPKPPSVTHLPREKPSPPETSCSFSFAHWVQIQDFGLNCEKVDINWFVALLGQLKELCHLKVNELFTDRRLARDIRFHPIDWGSSRTTITKQIMQGLIPEKYRTLDYEIAQFQISQANGRVIGFFDEKWIFRILLLDPMHNMILSKKPNNPNFRIRETTELLTTYQKLYNQLIEIKSKFDNTCFQEKCSAYEDVKRAINTPDEKVFICLEDYCDGEIVDLLKTKYSSLDDLIIEALDLLYKYHNI